MDTTYEEEELNSPYGELGSWRNPPKKRVIIAGSSEPILYSNLEESARSLAQACIMAYGIRFDTSAMSGIYGIIEEAVIEIKRRKEENDFIKIGAAQRNLVDFISQIVQTANDEKLTSVDGKKVKAVRELQFCPVYPFS